jgi:cytochrome c peroxidase
MSKTRGLLIWVRAGAALAVAMSVVGGCAEEEFSDDEWRRIDAIEPLRTEMPANPFNDASNPRMVDIAKLGQMLFFDKQAAEAITVAGSSGSMGEKGKISCQTCHDTAYLADSRPGRTSHGRTGYGSRNTPALVNLGYYDWTLWTGRLDSLVEHGAGAIGVAGTRVNFARFVYAKYKNEYNAAFPEKPLDERLGINPLDPTSVFPATANPKAAGAADGPWERMPEDARQAIYDVQAAFGRAWDAYPRQLKTPNSPFEQFVKTRGGSDTLTPEQKRGLKLFIGKAACNDCHNGPMLTDSLFHNIGVPDPVTPLPGQTTAPAPDRGRASGIVATIAPLAQLATWEATPGMARPAIFNGAGPFSDNRSLGKTRLEDLKTYADLHCLEGLDEMGACRNAKWDDTLEGVFRTPTLLNVAQTAPYFHTGEAATLDAVVRHYNKGGGQPGTFVGTKAVQLKPLGLTEQEIADLVAFMQSLSGDAPDPDWTANIAKPALPAWPPAEWTPPPATTM